MKKNIIKILFISILSISLVACNEIPTTSTSQELNNIYFLTDKEYTYNEIIEWAIEDNDVKSSSLIATVFAIDCDKVKDNQTYIDVICSKTFGQMRISYVNPDDNITTYYTVDTNSFTNSEYLINDYNAVINADITYTFLFGKPKEDNYVLNDIKFENGKHYVVFCGTIEQLLDIQSHKGENRIHNGSNVIS